VALNGKQIPHLEEEKFFQKIKMMGGEDDDFKDHCDVQN
jgi:hypothetical protein